MNSRSRTSRLSSKLASTSAWSKRFRPGPHLKSKSKANEDDNKISEFFPYFYWVLRDFSLDLKGASPQEYLESTLKPIAGTGPEIDRKNEIRDKIRRYFRQRDCLCLVRPVTEEGKLAHIEEQDWFTLRPAFMYEDWNLHILWLLINKLVTIRFNYYYCYDYYYCFDHNLYCYCQCYYYYNYYGIYNPSKWLILS